MPGDNAIAMRSVSVSFGSTRALDDVSLDVRSGEVLALLGGNGSGKSTLIKVLAGVQPARPGGTLVLGGEAVATERYSPSTARAHGLRFVHQHPGLFGDLTVAENLAIGHGYPRTAAGGIAWRELRARAREVLDRFHLDVDPGAIVEHLRPAQQMMISIARALQHQEPGRGALVLDEPTAALPVAETGELLAAVRRYAERGTTIIYVSHRLSEILAVADRAVVLRDGRVTGEYARAEVTERVLVEAIIGRALGAAEATGTQVADGERTPVLELRDVSAGPLRDVTLAARRHEVTGLAGLVGSGRSSLLRTVFGEQRATAGTVLVDGRALAATSPRAAMRAGIAYVSEDRAGEAAFAELSVRENLSAADLRRYWKAGWLRRGAERSDARAGIEALAIRSASAEAPVATLSGGNQQKVMISRWLRRSPRLLLLDEPTQGVDVGARQEIHRLIRGTVDAGSAALLVSSDFDELAAVCDRVYVLAGGGVVCEAVGDEIDAQRLGELAHLGVAA